MKDDWNSVFGQKVLQKGSEIGQSEGHKGIWQRISEEGNAGVLTEKGMANVKKALGCKELRLIHPETGFDKCGLILDITTIPPKGGNLLHRHNCWEVMYVLNGKGKFIVESKEFPVEKGDAINIPPNSLHKSINIGSEPWEYLAVTSPPLTAQMDDIPTAIKYGYLTVIEED